MPPKKPAKLNDTTKRTQPDDNDAASDDDTTKVARVIGLVDDSEDGSACESDSLAPEEVAKRLFMKSASVPCPEAKHTSGGGGCVNVEGIVVRSSKVSAAGKPKMMITVFATKITSSSTSPVVCTGVEGITFALPTKNLEASPDEIAKDAHAKGPVLIDVDDANTKTGYLGLFTTSFYTDGGQKNDKAEGSAVEACVTGTRVIVSNVSCTYGKGSNKIWVNAKKIQAISPVIRPGGIPRFIMSEMCSASAQNTATVLLSSTMHGFFGLSYDEAVVAEQATEIKDKWNAIVSNAASKCESLAAIAKSTDEDLSNALTANANRIYNISGHDAAQGMQLFNNDLPKDCTTQYVAPIVVRGVAPGGTSGYFCNTLFDASKRNSLPPSFCEGLVVAVKTAGNLITVDYRLFFVANRDKAIDATKAMKNPVLQSENTAASTKMSVRTVGPEMVGSLVKAKVEMAINETMYVMDHVAFVSIFPRAASDISVDGYFTNTSGYDFCSGVMKVGVRVSQEYIDKIMMGGRGVFIHKNADGVELIDPLSGTGPQPTLSKNLYQAVSEGSFDFDSLNAPDGMEMRYYVVYAGCGDNVKNTPEICTSVDEGERHIGNIVAAVRNDGDAKSFLRDDAIVYVVAVSATPDGAY